MSSETKHINDASIDEKMLKGNIYYKARRYNVALMIYEEIINTNDKCIEAIVEKGNCLRKLHRHQDALKIYDQALALDQVNISAYNGKCYLLINRKEYSKALELHEKVVQINPLNAVTYNCKGQILKLQKRYSEAIEAFSTAINLACETDNIGGYYYNKGLVLTELEKYREAYEAYNKAASYDPKNLKYRKEARICKTHLSDSVHDKCQLNFITNTLSSDEVNRDAYVRKGHELFEKRRFVEAMHAYDNAISFGTKDVLCYRRLGGILARYHHYDEAIRKFTTAIKFAPQIPGLHVEKGQVLLKARMYEEAMQSFEEALQLDPSRASAYAGKGHVLLALNRSMDALKWYTDAIELHTTDAFCYSNAGDILNSLHLYQEAIQMYETSLQYKPQLTSAYIGMGEALVKLGQFTKAMIAYNKALYHDRKNSNVHSELQEVIHQISLNTDIESIQEVVKELTQVEQDHERLRFLVLNLDSFDCPVYIRFVLFQHFIVNVSLETQDQEIERAIGKHYYELFDVNNVNPEVLRRYIYLLSTILSHLSVYVRAKALTLFAQENDICIAQLLIYLAPFSLTGLTSLAHQVTQRWVVSPRDDDLVVRFYHVLDSYNVPFEDSDWLFAQELMVEGLYVQAKPILAELVKIRPTTERLWLLATAMWHRHDPAHAQVEVLRKYIASSVPSDIRCGEAWQHIGELLLQDDGVAAIAAFEEAEKYHHEIPQLDAYRLGNWDAIPGLQHHPNDAFPPVVVIDLESEYQPDAAPGSGVFEIAAVRIKGCTELARFHAIIKRDFATPKVRHLQDKAVEPERAIRGLQAFIGSSFIAGHNLQAFDSVHLRAMGLYIAEDQILDTLSLARLLYPDSIHHHLGLLCRKHGIAFEGEQHTALPDAQVCAQLLYALGDELVRRGPELLNGFRAFVPAGCAFDRAILRPRGIIVDAALPWNIEPAPVPLHILVAERETIASPGIIEALEQKIDALVERNDLSGAYVQHLPGEQRTVVVVNGRLYIERMLAISQQQPEIYVLPDSHTLLCPKRLRQSIEQEEDWQMKLRLYCLYHASHNHDAQTLYPLRIPTDDDSLQALRRILIASCCSNDCHHSDTCPGVVAARRAAKECRIAISTHDNFLYYPERIMADTIVIDDIDSLQMHFAEYLVEKVTGEQIRSWSQETFDIVNTHISDYVKEYASDVAQYERISLQRLLASFSRKESTSDSTFLSLLQEMEQSEAEVARIFASLCQQALQGNTQLRHIHAYWLEVQIVHAADGTAWDIEQWRLCGVSRNIQKAFHGIFWEPFTHHILCGTAISLGGSGTTFLTRFFGLPATLRLFIDQRDISQVYIPPEKEMRPASNLARYSWAQSAGKFLYRLTRVKQQSIVVSLRSTAIAQALAETLRSQQRQTSYQVVSLHQGWPTAKIAERLADVERSTMAFLSPHTRERALDGTVDIEVTGPLRFLNQQDPLVAAQVQLFAQLYPGEHSFSSYLIPQALLELKTRLSSSAKLHIILDSGLDAKMYRDEVYTLIGRDRMLPALPGILGTECMPSETFIHALAHALEAQGLSLKTRVDDAMLHLTLQTIWGTETFKEKPLNQKRIVQDVFDIKDQLVIAATGGGKSLCFQLPAVLMAQDTLPKVTLVISPLIALMKDQVEMLHAKGVDSAIMWNSHINSLQKKQYLEGIKRGWYSIIYIAPEQIHSSAISQALKMREIGLVAIDEAHCVSEWGHNFRTEYIALKRWIETQLCGGSKRSFPIIALTATARNGYTDDSTGICERGTVQDIIDNLGLRLNPSDVEMSTPERRELEFSVEHIMIPCSFCHCPFESNTGVVQCPSCKKWCRIEEDDVKQAKLEKLVSLLAENHESGLRSRWDKPYKPCGQRQRGLIYCAFTKTTEELAELLQSHPRLAGLRVVAYHGQMHSKEEKLAAIFRAFTSDDEDGVDVVVATNAFGMGIDVRRLGFVIHYDVPATLEAYIQEAGRAGRDAEFQQDGQSARCILFFHESDLEKRRSLSSTNTIDGQNIAGVYEALRTCNVHEDDAVYITTAEIQRLTGIGKKDKNNINSLLFYLERHTRSNGKPVIERGENTAVKWLLAFEHGYKYRIHDPNISPHSQQLIQKLQTDEFYLRERAVRAIDSVILAEAMEWEYTTLHKEIQNLQRRHILVNADRWSIRWSKSKTEAKLLVTQLEQGVIDLLSSVPKSDRSIFINGKCILIDIKAIYDKSCLKVLPLAQITHFLTSLSQKEGILRLFTRFTRKILSQYELQLVTTGIFKDIRENLFQTLQQVIDNYAADTQSDKWLALDMLTVEADYARRDQLKQCLLLLKEIGLLSLEQLGKQDIAMRINFQQKHVTEDQLDIDLAQLRLIEQHNRRKLELIKEYAFVRPEQPQAMVNAYFAGTTPLLAPFKMWPNLTSQQYEIVMMSGGYHLITGPAGSGKTKILEEHIRYLIEEKFVPPEHILVVTHYNSGVARIGNNAGAKEMYHYKGRSVVAKTLNNVGERIFKQYRRFLLRPDGEPLFAKEAELRTKDWNSKEESLIMSQVLDEMRREEKYQFYRNWLSVDNTSVEYRLQTMQRFCQCGVFFTCPDEKTLCSILGFEHTKVQTAKFLHEMYYRYLLLRANNNIYTYDDQIIFALAILQTHPELARKKQWQYEHIIVDEFQDLTSAQRKLIGILSRGYHNVMAFGDDAQDIRVRQEKESTEPFKGNKAPVSHLAKRFEEISGTISPPCELQTNFRSVQEILNVASCIRNDGRTQFAQKGACGKRPTVLSVMSNPSSSDSQRLRAMVSAALKHIQQLPDKGGSVALIVALSKWSQSVQAILKDRGEPFCVLENANSYQSLPVARTLAYLRLIIDNRQDDEVVLVLQQCLPRKTIDQLYSIAHASGQPLFDIMQDQDILQQVEITSEQTELLQQHLDILKAYHATDQFGHVWQAVRELISDTLTTAQNEQQQTQLDGVLHTYRDTTVTQALADIRSHRSFLDEHSANRQLVVTTIDNAKSQAFDTVFLLDPDTLDINFANTRARLYVSVSRAKERLFFLVNAQSSENQEEEAFLPWLDRGLYEVLS